MRYVGLRATPVEQNEQGPAVALDDGSSMIAADVCSIDGKGKRVKRTLGEMEQVMHLAVSPPVRMRNALTPA